MAKEFVTIVVNNDKLTEIKTKYSKYIVLNSGEYIVFCAKLKALVVTAYSSKKEEEFKISFVGEDALTHAREFDETAELHEVKHQTVSSWIDLGTQMGSDEVGTGDFFGPIIVAAALVTKADIQQLREIGIDDSKKLTDKFIRETIPGILNKYRFVKVECTPEQYNGLIAKNWNMNKVKAFLHNKALLYLSTKYKGNYPTYIDQFCPETTYFNYLENVKEVKKDVVFHTKGESYYPSVALASCLARYYFLTKMDEMHHLYGMSFPLGAGEKADEFAKKFIGKFGSEKLKCVCKTNFKNYDELFKKTKKK